MPWFWIDCDEEDNITRKIHAHVENGFSIKIRDFHELEEGIDVVEIEIEGGTRFSMEDVRKKREFEWGGDLCESHRCGQRWHDWLVAG